MIARLIYLNKASVAIQALQEVGKVLVDVDLSEFDLTAVCGSFGGTNHVGIAPSTALNSLKNFMEGYTSQLEQSHHAKDIEQGKLFRQALMLLASPNGIALTTAEDIILQASQEFLIMNNCLSRFNLKW